MRIRAFVAIKIDKNSYNDLHDVIKRVPRSEELSWESLEKSHLTLKFIKEFETRNIQKAIDSLKEISKNNFAFSLKFSKINLFYRNNNPAIIYAEIERNDKLEKLYNDINKMFVSFSVEKEKRTFKPHLTLLRIRRNMTINNLDEYIDKDISDIKNEVNNIYLIKSELTSKGSIYSDIEKFYLK